MELIVVLLLGGAGFALGRWAIARRRRAVVDEAEQRRAAEEAASRGLHDLRPGDVLSHDGDWLVSGVAHLTESGESWIECRLEDASREAWVLIHPRDPEGLLFGERVSDLGGVTDEPSEAMEHRGAVFRLERHGRAEVEVEGDLDGRLARGECRYWNYRRPGDRRIWLRRFEERWSHFAGQRVRRHLVGFLPAS